jgi:putative DNA methylase
MHCQNLERSMMPRKKLIEVALPLEAINKASAREKSIRHGHPSTLHLWWARRPLAAARAVIFAQMVDDPSTYVDVLRSDSKIKRKAKVLLEARRTTWQDARALADVEHERLSHIIEDRGQWENTTNGEVQQPARDEIWQSWRHNQRTRINGTCPLF